jgi:archaellum component FlaC
LMDSETAEEVKRHFNVVAEALRADIRIVIEGLSANTERLDGVEVRLDRVEGRLERVELRLDGVEHRLDGVVSELGGVKAMIRPLIARSDA